MVLSLLLKIIVFGGLTPSPRLQDVQDLEFSGEYRIILMDDTVTDLAKTERRSGCLLIGQRADQALFKSYFKA